MSLGIPPPYERATTQEPTINELQQSASQELSKLRWGLIPEDMLVPFEQMQKNTTWKYTADSGHPSLRPMGILRGTGADSSKGEGLAAHYGALVNVLPEDVKDELAAQNKLTPEERNPLFFALEMTVRWLAMTSLFLSKAKNAEMKEGVKNEALLNLHIPDLLLMAAKCLIEEEGSLVEKLTQINHPETESILSDWQELRTLARQF